MVVHTAAHHTADTASLFAEEKKNITNYPYRNYTKVQFCVCSENLPLLGWDKLSIFWKYQIRPV